MYDKKKRVVIIGGGVGGLAVGCYLHMNGYSTVIFEKNSKCGGVSFAWTRRGYTFDGATNWLAGSSDSANMHHLLKELIDFNELKIIDPEEFISVELENATFHVYSDANKLKDEMLRIAPEDRKTIIQFTDAVRKVGTFSLPYKKAPELFNVIDLLQMLFKNLPFILFFSKWKRITIGAFASRFKNPTLRQLFLNIFPHHHHFSVFSVLMTLGWMNVRSGGYPIGGSAKFNETLEKKYLSLGGEIRYNSPVSKINVKGKKVTGISTVEGGTYDADLVISAMDLHYTLEKLLQISPESFTSYDFDNFPVFPSLIQVSIGCKKQLTGISHKLQMALQDKLFIHHDSSTTEELHDMMVRVCNFDKTLSPEGCTSIIVHFRTMYYKNWVDLRKNNREQYNSLKQRIAESVISTLDKRFNGIKDSVEVVDVATPATFIRYTNIFKGSYQGWAPAPSIIGKTLPKQIKSIENLYFAGQWVWPAGGLPGVIRIGRQTAQIICHRDKIKFKVEK